MKIDLSKWELHPQENEQARKFKELVLATLLCLPEKHRNKVCTVA